MASYGFLYDFFIPLLEPAFPLFDLLFGWVFSVFELSIAPQISLGLLSIVLAGLISVVYYILIDKEKYDAIREKQQEYQDKIKEARDNDDMEKANKYISENMKLQKDFMKVSLKPILGSMVLFFLIIPWVLHTFVPVVELTQQGDSFQGEFTFMDGRYSLGEIQAVNNTGEDYVLQYDNETYEQGERVEIQGMSWKINEIDTSSDQPAVKFALSFVKLPFGLPLIGDSLEWLGYYIIFQLPFTFIFRRMLGLQ